MNRLCLPPATTLLLALAICACPVRAQISITEGNLTYSQNFNHGYGTGSLAWTDNATLAGWYLYMNAVGTPASVTTQITATGTSAGPIYLLSHGTATDNFALVARITNDNGSTTDVPGSGYYFGLRLTNDTGGTITDFSLAYTGVQSYRSTGLYSNTITPSYSIVAGGSSVVLNTGTWTDIPGLAFTAPQNGTNPGGSATTVNFNTDGNYTAFSGVNVTGLTWNDGEELWFRWWVNNVEGNDQGVGIDNISFIAGTPTVIPEPATATLLCGAASLAALLAWRRRRPTAA
jgi:hypothetical protein